MTEQDKKRKRFEFLSKLRFVLIAAILYLIIIGPFLVHDTSSLAWFIVSLGLGIATFAVIRAIIDDLKRDIKNHE